MRYLKMSLLTSLIIYITVSFILWDYLWLVDSINNLPNYDTEERMGILTTFLFKIGVDKMLIDDEFGFGSKKDNSEKKLELREMSNEELKAFKIDSYEKE